MKIREATAHHEALVKKITYIGVGMELQEYDHNIRLTEYYKPLVDTLLAIAERHKPKLADENHFHPDWAEKVQADYYICSSCIVGGSGGGEETEYASYPCITIDDIETGLDR